MYQKLTGKIMYLVTKILVEGSNAAQELARQFGNPNDAHWVELGMFVGYLKRHRKLVKLIYRKPKDLRVLSNVDSNYATDEETCKSASRAIHTIIGTIVNWLSKTHQSLSHTIKHRG
jgi:hypothetical protein